MIHANTAAVGQLNYSASLEMMDWVRKMRQPEFYHSSYTALSAAVETCRARAAELLGSSSTGNGFVDVDDVALLNSTSEGIAIASEAGMNLLGDRKNVVVTKSSFISTRVQSLVFLANECGVVEAGDETGFISVDHIRAVPDVGMVILDHVNYISGVRNQIEELADYCGRHEIVLIIDAVQSLGTCSLDCNLKNIDAVACGAHKWLLGPEGTALLYMSRRLSESRPLRRLGYRSLVNPADFDQTVSPDALCHGSRGVEVGTQNAIGFAGFSAALSDMLAEGMSVVLEKTNANTAGLMESLRGHRSVFGILTPEVPERRAGIVSFYPSSGDPASTLETLRNSGIQAGSRRGAIRLSPSWNVDLPQLIDRLQSGLASL